MNNILLNGRRILQNTELEERDYQYPANEDVRWMWLQITAIRYGRGRGPNVFVVVRARAGQAAGLNFLPMERLWIWILGR